MAKLAPTVAPVTVKVRSAALLNDIDVGENVKPLAGVGVIMTSVIGAAETLMVKLTVVVPTKVAGYAGGVKISNALIWIAPLVMAAYCAELVPLIPYAIVKDAPTMEPVTVKVCAVAVVKLKDAGVYVSPPATVGVTITLAVGAADGVTVNVVEATFR